MPDQPQAPTPKPGNWWEAPAPSLMRSPWFMLLFSGILAAGCVAVLLSAGKNFGAMAFGGGNVLACLIWLLVRRQAQEQLAKQTTAEALVGWMLGTLWSAGVTALYFYGQDLWGSILLGGVLTLYVIGSWGLAYAPAEGESDEAMK